MRRQPEPHRDLNPVPLAGNLSNLVDLLPAIGSKSPASIDAERRCDLITRLDRIVIVEHRS